MINMDCKQLARVMPLYIGGDLGRAEELKVGAHLSFCEDCRRMSESYEVSRSLLIEAFQPPAFDERFYAGIRNAVLGRINQQPPRGRFSFLSGIFSGRHFVYATAAASVLVVVAVLYQLVYHRSQPLNYAGVIATGAKQNFSTPLPGTGRGPGVVNPKQKHSQTSRITQIALRRYSSIGPAPEKRGTVESNSTIASVQASQSDAENVTPSNVTRIEIQTANPNIRIIWLGSQGVPDPKQADPEKDHTERRIAE